MSRLSVPIAKSEQTDDARPSNRTGWEVYPCLLVLECSQELEVIAMSLDQGPQDDNAKQAPQLSWPCPRRCQHACTWPGRSDRVMEVEREINLLDGWVYSELDVQPGPGRTMLALWEIWLGVVIAAVVGVVCYLWMV